MKPMQAIKEGKIFHIELFGVPVEIYIWKPPASQKISVKKISGESQLIEEFDVSEETAQKVLAMHGRKEILEYPVVLKYEI